MRRIFSALGNYLYSKIEIGKNKCFEWEIQRRQNISEKKFAFRVAAEESVAYLLPPQKLSSSVKKMWSISHKAIQSSKFSCWWWLWIRCTFSMSSSKPFLFVLSRKVRFSIDSLEKMQSSSNRGASKVMSSIFEKFESKALKNHVSLYYLYLNIIDKQLGITYARAHLQLKTKRLWEAFVLPSIILAHLCKLIQVEPCLDIEKLRCFGNWAPMKLEVALEEAKKELFLQIYANFFLTWSSEIRHAMQNWDRVGLFHPKMTKFLRTSLRDPKVWVEINVELERTPSDDALIRRNK